MVGVPSGALEGEKTGESSAKGLTKRLVALVAVVPATPQIAAVWSPP